MHVLHYEKGIRYNDKEFLLMARKIGSLGTKCSRLVKDDGSSIRVEAERRDTKKKADAVKVTVTITLPEKVLRAESRKPAVIDAVESCVKELTPQLAKYKELHTARGIHMNRHRKSRR